MADKPANVSFLDLEHCSKDTEGEQTPEQYIRPWKAYWPPQCGNKLYSWLCSEYPEVLTYQFHPDRPFDRPWRTWTRSARAKQEAVAEAEPRQNAGLVTGKHHNICCHTSIPLFSEYF